MDCHIQDGIQERFTECLSDASETVVFDASHDMVEVVATPTAADTSLRRVGFKPPAADKADIESFAFKEDKLDDMSESLSKSQVMHSREPRVFFHNPNIVSWSLCQRLSPPVRTASRRFRYRPKPRRLQ